MVGSCATKTFNTMATGDDTKLPLTSRDVHAERLTQFRELFPEAFTEGKADLKKLAQQLSVFAVSAKGSASASPAVGACGSCGDPRGPGSCSIPDMD